MYVGEHVKSCLLLFYFLMTFIAHVIGIRNANVWCNIDGAEISKGEGAVRPLPRARRIGRTPSNVLGRR